MSNPAALTAAAQSFLPGEAVLAAGVFGLQDNYAAITVGGVVAGVATPPGAPVAVDAAAQALAVHASREVAAAAQGLAVRMLVAVTETSVHVLDWDGSSVHREFVVFPRATLEVTITRFGASRRVHLRDPQSGHELEITGSTGFLSSEAAGDKLVLALLA